MKGEADGPPCARPSVTLRNPQPPTPFPTFPLTGGGPSFQSSPRRALTSTHEDHTGRSAVNRITLFPPGQAVPSWLCLPDPVRVPSCSRPNAVGRILSASDGLNWSPAAGADRPLEWHRPRHCGGQPSASLGRVADGCGDRLLGLKLSGWRARSGQAGVKISWVCRVGFLLPR